MRNNAREYSQMRIPALLFLLLLAACDEGTLHYRHATDPNTVWRPVWTSDPLGQALTSSIASLTLVSPDPLDLPPVGTTVPVAEVECPEAVLTAEDGIKMLAYTTSALPAYSIGSTEGTTGSTYVVLLAPKTQALANDPTKYVARTYVTTTPSVRVEHDWNTESAGVVEGLKITTEVRIPKPPLPSYVRSLADGLDPCAR